MKKVKYKDAEREFEMSNSTFEKIIDGGEMPILFGKTKSQKWYQTIFKYYHIIYVLIKNIFPD